jgi:hypothetical protein
VIKMRRPPLKLRIFLRSINEGCLMFIEIWCSTGFWCVCILLGRENILRRHLCALKSEMEC